MSRLAVVGLTIAAATGGCGGGQAQTAPPTFHGPAVDREVRQVNRTLQRSISFGHSGLGFGRYEFRTPGDTRCAFVAGFALGKVVQPGPVAGRTRYPNQPDPNQILPSPDGKVFVRVAGGTNASRVKCAAYVRRVLGWKR